jgi:hypothetical protein
MPMPWKSLTIKTYPNKYKAQNQKAPDVTGTVEVIDLEGQLWEYQYAQWKPGAGKKQTLTKWSQKRDKPQEGATEAVQSSQTQEPPKAPAIPKTAVDDTAGW